MFRLLTHIVKQSCGTVTIFYGSGSDFWKLWFRFRFWLLKKLWFRFRFRFRFLLLKSYGSGSGSSSISTVYHKKQIFLKKFVSFLHFKLFYKEKNYKYQQIYCKMWKKKMLNEGNQINNSISSSGSGTVINYGSGSDFLTSYGSCSGSGSTRQKVTVPTVPVPVPVPQHCCKMHGLFRYVE